MLVYRKLFYLFHEDMRVDLDALRNMWQSKLDGRLDDSRATCQVTANQRSVLTLTMSWRHILSILFSCVSSFSIARRIVQADKLEPRGTM